MAFQAFFSNRDASKLLGMTPQNFSRLVSEEELLSPALPSVGKCRGRKGYHSAWSIIQLEIWIDVSQFERTGGEYGMDRETGKIMLDLSLKRLGKLSTAQLDTGAELYREIMREIKEEMTLRLRGEEKTPSQTSPAEARGIRKDIHSGKQHEVLLVS